MNKRLISSLLIVATLLLIVSTGVIASDVTGAEYLTTITVSNNSTSAQSGAFATWNLNTADMVTLGMLNASANDSVLRDSSGSDVAFGPSINATYPWVSYVPSIGANSQANQYLYTGNATGGRIAYFPANTGMTTAESATLRLGDNFTIEQYGMWDTTNATANAAVYKLNSIAVYIVVPGTIGIAITGGSSVSYSMGSGNHTVTSSANVSHLQLAIDGISVNSTVLGIAVPINANGYVFCMNGIMPYLEYQKIWINGVLQQEIRWEYATIFSDLSGNNHTATPTFRTEASSNITAEIVSQISTGEQDTPSPDAGSSATLVYTTNLTVQPSNMYTGNGTGFPGSGPFIQIASDLHEPVELLTIPLAMFTVVVAGLGVFALTNRPSVGVRGSLFLTCLTIAVVCIPWIIWEVLPAWIEVPWGFGMVLMLLWRNPYSTPIG